MNRLLSSSLAAVMLTAGAAHAAPTITFSSTGPVGNTVIQNFDSFAPGSVLPTNTLILDGTVTNVGVQPTGSTGNYAAVLGGGSYSVGFGATSAFTFLLGSLDSYNALTLSFDDKSTVSYVGSDITAGLGSNGYVTYTSTGPRIVGATFSSSINSFEIDNLSSAVPEPATWTLLIAGFGLVGASMRRRTTLVRHAA